MIFSRIMMIMNPTRIVPDDLWGHEPLCAAEALRPGGQRGPAYPVVRQFDVDRRSGVVVTVAVSLGGEGLRDAPDEDVLGLEVPVDDVVLVEVLQGQHQLGGVEPDHLLREALALGKTPERADNVEK